MGTVRVREWLSNDGCFIFGKWKGEIVQDVALEDPSYPRWILENVEDIHHEDRYVIETVLSFRKRK